MTKLVSKNTEMEGQENEISPGSIERRSETRSNEELYSSVEFSLKNVDYINQFFNVLHLYQ